MVKTEMRCSSCGGRITAVRDLEDVAGTAEVEEHHLPGCPTVSRHVREEAQHLASQPALWVARKERTR